MKAARFILTALSALLLLSAASCGKDKTEEVVGERTIVVETAEVAHRTTAFPIHTAGMVSLKETVKLSFNARKSLLPV